jgi:hypothetical protein
MIDIYVHFLRIHSSSTQYCSNVKMGKLGAGRSEQEDRGTTDGVDKFKQWSVRPSMKGYESR